MLTYRNFQSQFLQLFFYWKSLITWWQSDCIYINLSKVRKKAEKF